MSLANRLYDRPNLDQQFGALALYVTGSLPIAVTEATYEGRLQIHNAIGACSVEVLDGVIPPGGQIYVDNATSEVVVAWPAYSETPSPPDNAGFETGDLTGWSYSTVGGGGAPVVTSNYPHGGSYSAYWAGGKGLGSEGGIECVLLNDKACVAYPGQRITFRASILYNPGGGTPKGSRGQVRLNWYDADDQLIDTSYGELIKGRAHNGKWADSTGGAAGPPGTKSARLAVWLTATGAGHSYCDDAAWDAPAIVGTKDDGIITLWLRVHDAGGRVADWSGATAVGSTAYRDAVLADAPLHYYRLGETNGTVLINSGTSGIDTTWGSNASNWSAPGLVTGDADRGILIPPGTISTSILNPSFVTNTDFTVEVIIKPMGASSGGGVIWSYGPAASNSPGVDYVDAGGGKFRLRYMKVGTAVIFVSAASYAYGTKLHVVIRYTRSTGLCEMWINGVKEATTGSFVASATTYNMVIANQNFPNWITFNGYMDEVAYYNYLLSPARIAAHAALA